MLSSSPTRTLPPPSAASTAEAAIFSGVTGTRSLLPTVSPTPVTAQVTNTSQFILCTITTQSGQCEHEAPTYRPRPRGSARRRGAPSLRKPGRRRATPRPARRRGGRLPAGALHVAALRPVARVADDRAAAVAD